jgi:hypothetical protein
MAKKVSKIWPAFVIFKKTPKSNDSRKLAKSG